METQKDDVSVQHPDYQKSARAREIWCDVMEGTLRLREKCKTYLPQFHAETDKAYKYRASTATLFNIAEKTRNVMCGLVFQDEIKLGEDVDPTIAALCENIDNGGRHLNVFARDVFEDSFAGWSAILVDAPAVKADSLEEERALNLRPYWVAYKAADVINWRHRINPVSKAKELEQIVLREVTHEQKGRFASEMVTRYRVFFLVNGVVAWQLYREAKNERGETVFVLEGSDIISRLTRIPVGFIHEPGDCPPLTDIALANVKHFQKESDFDSILHKSCTPLPWARDLEVKDGEKFIISPDKLTLVGGEKGEIGWAEIAGSGIAACAEDLKDLREQMALMGLSLLSDKTATGDLTATEALLNNIGETAELRVWATRLKDAIELCLGHTAEYLGLTRDKGGSVTLGTAWSTQQGAQMPSNSDLMARLDAANKADGLLPLKERLKLVYPDMDDAQIAEMMTRLSAEQAVDDQNQTYGR